MALADILAMGAAALPRYSSADREKLNVYQDQLNAYQSQIDTYNKDVGTYNTAVTDWKKDYDPWLKKAEAYNNARAEWERKKALADILANAGPRNSNFSFLRQYSGPANPGPWTGADVPTVPKALSFTVEEAKAYDAEAQAYRDAAKERGIGASDALRTAYSVFGAPSQSISYGVPGGGTNIEFSFSGAGFAQGGVVPPINQGIGSIFGQF